MSHLLLEGLAGVSSGSQEEREGVRRSAKRKREKQANQDQQILLTVDAHQASHWSKVCCPLCLASESPSPSHLSSPS